jgi:hypothetical protein
MSLNMLAIHEAGHAVASVVLNLNLQVVTIEPRYDEKRGFLVPGFTGSLPTRPVTDEEKLIQSISGMLAEIKAETGTTAGILLKDLDDTFERAEDDIQTCDEIVVKLDAGSVNRSRQVLADAAILVEKYWDAIEAVAIVLEIHTTLDGACVSRIVEASGPEEGMVFTY